MTPNITMYGTSKFIRDTLNDSTVFKAFTITEIGKEMDYLLFIDMAEVQNNTFPDNYISLATYENKDRRATEFSFRTSMVINIKRFPTVTVGNLKEESTFEKLEKIALKAKELLYTELELWGIQGDKSIKIDLFDMYTPAPMGEDSLQMQIDININKDKFLC